VNDRETHQTKTKDDRSMVKQRNVWFVVADGSHARIVVKRPEETGYDTIREFSSAEARKPTRALVSDKPGRSIDSPTPGRSPARHGMAPATDTHRLRKREFALSLADEINRASQRNAFDDLVLVAPARSLTHIRGRLDHIAKAKMLRAVAKDLTNLPQAELFRQLDQIGARRTSP
jgi:protein required for attachment to host cells